MTLSLVCSKNKISKDLFGKVSIFIEIISPLILTGETSANRSNVTDMTHFYDWKRGQIELIVGGKTHRLSRADLRTGPGSDSLRPQYSP